MLCQCPKLTPLQSRLLASVTGLALIALLYWSLSDKHFAYAAELEVDGSGWSRGGEDHNWHRIAEERLVEDGIEVGLGEESVEGWERLELRQENAEAKEIGGNDAGNLDNIEAGSNTVWRYARSLLEGPRAEVGPGLPENVTAPVISTPSHKELRRRADEQDDDLERRQSDGARTVYISINTCLQPTYSGDGTQTESPPQLTLYIATDSSNRNPGPRGDADSQIARRLTEGFASHSFTTSGDTYMSVSAPSLPDGFTGVWNYELAVSIDDFFHSADTGTPDLFLVDSDNAAALLVTANLTQANATQESYEQWMALSAPYSLFASNIQDPRTLGLRNSYCGLNELSQLASDPDDLNGTTSHIQMSMITRGQGKKPKQQFHLSALNASSAYLATLALTGNSTASGPGVVGGGGKVWQPVPFTTKSDPTCGLLYDLDFCDEVAYAVPSAPDVDFRFLYDNYTRFYYQMFNYSLQQIPCETSRDAQYSLAKNCDDCAAAYKEWLCAVSIPRCEDFSNPASFLMKRNMGQPFQNGTSLPEAMLNEPFWPMPGAPTLDGSVAFSQTYGSSIATNSSRNRMIDSAIRPGPYKEVLPCEDLCYSLVQSCPSSLGFGCPFPGKGLNTSYGNRDGIANGTITCSYLGAYVYVGGVGVVGARVWLVVGIVVLVGLVT